MLFGLFQHSFAAVPQLECEYNSQFQQCVEANKNGAARSIKDFPCLQTTQNARILDQIILHEEFSKIDEQAETFMQKLEQDKESALKDMNTNIDAISNNLGREGVYYQQYKDLCNWWILKKRAECTEKVANTEAGRRLKDAPASQGCMQLVQDKLATYRQVSYDIQKLNKNKVLQDRKKQYVQQERTKYTMLTNMMMYITWHLERIWNGLTHYTPKPKQ